MVGSFIRHVSIPFALLMVAAFAPAQQEKPAVVIKTETRVVQVDAVVTDRSGTLVEDLTAKDFHVWEDNKEQTITSFSVENHSGPGAAPSYTVLFFNNPNLDMSAQSRARAAAQRFVAANAGPENLMAVAEFNDQLTVTQNFTADAQRLQQAVAGIDRAQFPTGAAVGRGNAADVAATTARETQRRFLQAIATLAANMINVPGRKTMLLFSAGMPVDSFVAPTMNLTVNVCNRSNLSVYPLEASGLVSADPAAANAARPTRRGTAADASIDPTPANTDQILHALAKGTGGYVNQNGNDMAGMLMKVQKEETGYYLLGYTPPDSPDGSCHALRVKVDRAAELRARASYCNTKATDLLAGKPVERSLEDQVNGDKGGNVTASMQLPFFYTEPGVARLNVSIDAPSDAIRFDRVKGKLHGEANVMGIAYLSDGSAAARFSDTVHYDFGSQKELDAFHAKPLHYEKEMHIAPGKYTFKVVFATGAGSFAKMESPLEIQPYAAGDFMVSGMAFSKEMHPASELGTAADEELLEGRTPLVFNDLRMVPAGTNHFQRADGLALIYLEVYDPLATTEHPPGMQIMLRVLDKKTGDEKLNGFGRIDAAAVSGNRSVPYGLRLKLSALQPGWYTAEVKVVDAAGKSMIRTADFEVR